jgi:hypothetical protein
MPAYKHTKIYYIQVGDKRYYGHTTMSLSQRRNCHRADFVTKPNREIYKAMRAAGMTQHDFEMVLVETFPCKNRNEAAFREKHWVNQDGQLNMMEPILTEEERKAKMTEQSRKQRERDPIGTAEYHRKYREEHQEEIRESKKEHARNNAEAIKEQRKKYREENAEKIKARKAADYLKNKQKRQATSAAYRAANKEAAAARNKAYYEANKERISAQQKQYYEANRDEIREKQNAAAKEKYRLSHCN